MRFKRVRLLPLHKTQQLMSLDQQRRSYSVVKFWRPLYGKCTFGKFTKQCVKDCQFSSRIKNDVVVVVAKRDKRTARLEVFHKYIVPLLSPSAFQGQLKFAHEGKMSESFRLPQLRSM